jgi:hypothetical protein
LYKFDMSGQVSLDESERVWTSLDKSGQVRTSQDKSGQVWTSLDKSGQVWTNLLELLIDNSGLLIYNSGLLIGLRSTLPQIWPRFEQV